MTAEPAATSVAEKSPVSRDLPCVNCGYNLRTLPPTGRCPECGSLVEHSLRNHELRFSNPDWLRTLHCSIRLLVWMSLLELLLTVVDICYGLVDPNESRQELVRQWLNVSSLAFGGLALWTVLPFTRPPPDYGLSPSDNKIRNLLRYTTFGMFTAAVGCQIVSVMGVAPTLIISMSPIILFFPIVLMPLLIGYLTFGVLPLVLSFSPYLSFQETTLWTLLVFFSPLLVYLYLWVLLLLHSRRLMIRIPHSGLVRSASMVFWGMTASLAVFLMCAFLFSNDFIQFSFYVWGGANSGLPTPDTRSILTVYLIGLAVLGIVVFTLCFFVLLFRLSRALGQAAKQAAQNFPASQLDSSPRQSSPSE